MIAQRPDLMMGGLVKSVNNGSNSEQITNAQDYKSHVYRVTTHDI
jgi:hypothetical protein